MSYHTLDAIVRREQQMRGVRRKNGDAARKELDLLLGYLTAADTAIGIDRARIAAAIREEMDVHDGSIWYAEDVRMILCRLLRVVEEK